MESNYNKLKNFIFKQNSFLCVGLDSDINKIPEHLKKLNNPILEFNKSIIDATANYCVAFKPNTAFYEINGYEGWLTLSETIRYIKENYSEHLIIVDAKRGDIGNTSTMYAKAFFETLNADAVTVTPYMGSDSVKPFLDFKNKWTVVLGLTSNEGATDFQLKGETFLYEEVIKKVNTWGNVNNLMFVVGATKAETLRDIRKIIPDHFILVPGVGTQGGSLTDVVNHGMNKNCGLIVNASRSIIYASSGTDFNNKASEEAFIIQNEMSKLLETIK